MKIIREVLGRTNRLLSFDTWTAQKTTRRTIFLLGVYSLHSSGLTESLPSNDKGIFTEPLPSNDKVINTTICIPSAIRNASGIQKLMVRGIQRQLT
jgi:hypothetical protein